MWNLYIYCTQLLCEENVANLQLNNDILTTKLNKCKEELEKVKSNKYNNDSHIPSLLAKINILESSIKEHVYTQERQKKQNSINNENAEKRDKQIDKLIIKLGTQVFACFQHLFAIFVLSMNNYYLAYFIEFLPFPTLISLLRCIFLKNFMFPIISQSSFFMLKI